MSDVVSSTPATFTSHELFVLVPGSQSLFFFGNSTLLWNRTHDHLDSKRAKKNMYRWSKDWFLWLWFFLHGCVAVPLLVALYNILEEQYGIGFCGYDSFTLSILSHSCVAAPLLVPFYDMLEGAVWHFFLSLWFFHVAMILSHGCASFSRHLWHARRSSKVFFSDAMVLSSCCVAMILSHICVTASILDIFYDMPEGAVWLFCLSALVLSPSHLTGSSVCLQIFNYTIICCSSIILFNY